MTTPLFIAMLANGLAITIVCDELIEDKDHSACVGVVLSVASNLLLLHLFGV